ncbi:Uncharacterised protein [Actinomyces bovis]|uniref:Phage-related protein n=1 Tax=Actinomyces bovis TaxID=1658 RepID=A0ABY1VNW3_9ACTO|nr:hypothetical protein [Actinomyces bovis]SPT53804.1 Uncharacterised protein [Actinomyces bovis]VEG53167.1 Uncharacterised protein [Actinomyces israelii]
MSEYTIDGQDLDDPQGRWRLTNATSLPTWGAPRLPNVEVPGRIGVLPLPPTSAAPATLVLGLLVQADDQKRATLDQNLRALAALLRPFGRLLRVTHRPAGAPVREATARLSGSVEPKFFPAAVAATVSVSLELPEGVWRDPVPTEMAAADLSKIDGGAMPISDAVILVASPGSPVKITDQGSGGSMTWSGVVPPGKALLLEPALYRASFTAGSWSRSGAVDASSGLSLSAGGFSITPDTSGHHAVTVTGGTAQIRARRAY